MLPIKQGIISWGQLGSWPFTPDLDYTERLHIWEIFNSQKWPEGRFLCVAEVCCIQGRLLPPDRDWGLGWASQPGPVPLPQPGKRAGGRAARSPHGPTSLWRGAGAATWPGSLFLVWGLGLGQTVKVQRGLPAPFGMGSQHGQRGLSVQGLSHREASRAGLGWQPGPELSPNPQSCLAAYPHCHQWEGAASAALALGWPWGWRHASRAGGCF